MSRGRVEWLVGTARLRAARFARSLRIRLRRHPVGAAVVPQPRRPRRGTPRLVLTHALVASDLNPVYLECWPLARLAWQHVAGLEPLLVVIAKEDLVPAELRDDALVHVVEPVEGVHTAFQAQAIRLLYPALVDTDGAVLTADVDMFPLSREYFHAHAQRVAASQFLAYRDVLLSVEEVPICYNAARPSTWRELFGIESIGDVHQRLAEWGRGLEYDGSRGGRGWETDQRILYRTLVERGRRASDVWILDDDFTHHRRLDREVVQNRRTLVDVERRGIQRGVYADFHCALPFDEFREVNELVVQLAVEAVNERAGSGRLR